MNKFLKIATFFFTFVILVITSTCSNASGGGNGPAPATPTYTVTFYSNGGSEVASQTVSSGQIATKPSDPTKDHFNFVEWCSDQACQTPFDFAIPITDDITLYAKWSNLPVYVVTFDLNGGKYGSSDTYTQNVETGSKAIRPASTPTKDDKISGDVTTKYTFDNWYADAEYGTLFNFDTTTISGPTTIYAKWNETMCYAVKIAENIEHGVVSSDATECVAVGTLVTLTASPNSGYEFGSYTVTDADSNPVSVTNGKFTMPASPVTVTATFTAIEYTITCGTSENGTVTSGVNKATIGLTVTLTVSANDDFELKSIIVKDSGGTNISVTEVTTGVSYTFTMPANNVIVTATFRIARMGDPLTLEALETDTTITFNNKANGSVIYKVNDGASQTIESGTNASITLSNAGDKVCFYGDNAAYATSYDNRTNIACNKDCYIYGNIMSLVDSTDYDNVKTLSKQYAFYSLFRDNTHIKNKAGADLRLPATTLSDNCYASMFYNCTALTKSPALPAMILAPECYSGMFMYCKKLTSAPELPATRLENSCYSSMFCGCTSLTNAPNLPATTLSEGCYAGMFSSCSNLSKAPALPATTLARYCYSAMFRDCGSITKAPDLPANTLAFGCYNQMFYSCDNLTTPPVLSATTLTELCYENMFANCSNLTVAPDLPATTLATRCYSFMFYQCKKIATAPNLPATSLADECYSYMFTWCTSLTKAPALPAKTLTSKCYSNMFFGCTKLNSVTCLATDISAENCTNNWLGKVTTTGNFKKSSEMTSWPNGDSGIPEGWTVE